MLRKAFWIWCLVQSKARSLRMHATRDFCVWVRQHISKTLQFVIDNNQFFRVAVETRPGKRRWRQILRCMFCIWNDQHVSFCMSEIHGIWMEFLADLFYSVEICTPTCIRKIVISVIGWKFCTQRITSPCIMLFAVHSVCLTQYVVFSFALCSIWIYCMTRLTFWLGFFSTACPLVVRNKHLMHW